MSKVHEDNAGYFGVSYEETQDPFYSYNKLSLPLVESDKTVIGDEVTFTVTVAGGKFVIDGTSQATVGLVEGNVYTFDQSDASNAGGGTHPLKFSYTADGTWGGGLEYALSVTTNGTPGQSGAYTKIGVPFGLHDLKYYCGNHSGMGGSANVVKNTKAFTIGRPILKTTDAFGKTLGSGNNADPYGANLVLAVPMNGTNNSTTFTDVSPSIRGSGSAKTLSVSGNAKVKTSPSSAFYYGSRGFFDGNGDRLQISTSTDLIFNGDFTIETWLNIDSSSSVSHPNGDRQIAGVWTGTDGDWQFNYAASGTHNLLQFLIYDGGTIVVDSAVNMSAYVGQTVHVAVTRNNNNIQIYLNGQAVGSPYQYAKSFGKTSNTAIGGRVGSDARSVNGFLTDFRIYQGVAKYTTPFPTGSYGMEAVTYSGNGATSPGGSGGTQNIVTPFAPDLVWIKDLSNNSHNHNLVDCIRGTGSILFSDGTNTEITNSTDAVTSLNSNGFTLGDNGEGTQSLELNHGNNDYVAWCWRAGGAPTATNSAGANAVPTAGSAKVDGSNMSTALAGTMPATKITVSTTYGFSIVNYTSPNSSNNQSFAHGLGKKPDFILTKNLDSTYNWDIYHSALGYNASLLFTNGGTRSGAFSAEPDASVVNTGNNYTHTGTDDYIAYCWSEVSGFSKFGSYESADPSDVTVNVGFKPKFVIIKSADYSSTTTSWMIYDSTRLGHGTMTEALMANKTAIQGVRGDGSSTGSMHQQQIQFTDTGFIVQGGGSEINEQTGNTYIYAAFAESAVGEGFESAIVDQLDLNDLSGNNNNASNGGITWQTSVKKFYDGAADFDGWVVMNVPASSDFAFGSGDFTIEYWVNTSVKTADGVYRRMFVLDGPTGDTGANLSLNIDAGSGHVIAWGGNAGPGAIVNQGVNIADSTWHHVACVRQGTSVSIYVDGSIQGTGTDSRSLFAGSTPAPRLGGSSSTGGRLDGYMQDVRIYKGIAKYTSSFSPPERSVQGTARRYPSGIYVVS